MAVDFRTHRISVDGKSAELTAAEWRIFYVLVSNDGRLISRASLLRQCFDYDSDVFERLLDKHIKNIRRKLGSTVWIKTVAAQAIYLRPIKSDQLNSDCGE